MLEPSSHWLEVPGGTLHYLRWGEPARDRPCAVLLHGLSFVGALFSLLGRAMAPAYTVYALDRRGHGQSRTEGGLDSFAALRDDLVRFIDALSILAAYGIGHSAGATDLLLAAALRPQAFARILVFEPTVLDPRAARDPDPELTSFCLQLLERTRRRPFRYQNRAEALAALQRRSPLKAFHPELLSAYVEYGFGPQADGWIAARCTPETEARMLVPIFQVMENKYRGDEFAALSEVNCPVRLISGGRSEFIYPAMAALAARCLPSAELVCESQASHFWFHEEPEAFAKEVEAFAGQGASQTRQGLTNVR